MTPSTVTPTAEHLLHTKDTWSLHSFPLYRCTKGNAGNKVPHFCLKRKTNTGCALQVCKTFFSAIEDISSKNTNPVSSFINYKSSRARWLFHRRFDTAKAEKAGETLQPQIKAPQKSALAVTSPSRINTAPSPPPHKKCTLFSTAKVPTAEEKLWNRFLSYLGASAMKEGGKDRAHTHQHREGTQQLLCCRCYFRGH